MSEVLKSLGYEIDDDSRLIGNVTSEKMKKGIIDFFKNAKYDDTLLFYYSGHGIPEIKEDLYLASSDVNRSFPDEGGFSFEGITKMIRRSISKQKVVIPDCCYSGAAKLGKGSAYDAAKLGSEAISNKGSQIRHTGEGTCILSASQAYQEALVLKERNHSLFTYYLLEGLQGSKEALNSGGYVTADSLSNFVYDAIMSLPSEKRFNQKPVMILEASGNIILASPTDLAQLTSQDTTPNASPATAIKEKSASAPTLDENTESRRKRYHNPEAEKKKRQYLLNNPKILIPTTAVVIGAVTVWTIFGGSIMRQQSPPTAIDQSVTTNLNKPVGIIITARDPDASNNLTASIIIKPLHGILGAINQDTGFVTYTPNQGFIGNDKFAFKVSDGKRDSPNIGTVSIVVTNKLS